MLESIRKYQWFMIAVFVLLAAGFLFTFNNVGSNSRADDTVLSVNNRNYDQQAYTRLGTNTIRLAQRLGFSQMLYSLASDAQRPNDQQFIVNRLIVQGEAKKLGLYPSAEQITNEIKEKIFVKDGVFDAESYNTLTSRILPSLNLGERDLVRLVGDKLALETMQTLVGGNLSDPQDFIKSALQEQSQQITVQRIAYSIDTFKDEIKPTEEEVKAYHAENTLSYMSDPEYKLTYVLTSPDYPEKPEPKEGEEADPEAEVNNTAARTKAENALSEKIDQLWETIYAAEGLEFETHAKDAGLEARTSEFFSGSNMPDELRVSLAPTAGGSQSLMQIISRTSTDGRMVDRLSNPLPVVGNKWLIFQLVGTKAAEPLSFEDAKSQAEADLINKKATEAMKEAAEESHKKLKELVAGGKSIAEAAKELELELTELGPFGRADRLPQEFASGQIFNSAKNLDPGSITDVIYDGSRSLFVYVDKRELEKSDTFDSQIDNAHQHLKRNNQTVAFDNWLNQKSEAAVDQALQVQ